MPRTTPLALLAILLTAVGCVRPPIADSYPQGARELVRVVPECREAWWSGPRYAACRKAAQILEEDPHAATRTYIANWQHVSGSRHGLGGGGGGGASDCNPGSCDAPSDCNLGSGGGGAGGAVAVLLAVVVVAAVVVVVVVAAEAADHHLRVSCSGRITKRALREVYRRSGDPWSQHMLWVLDESRYGSRGSLSAFMDAAGQ